MSMIIKVIGCFDMNTLTINERASPKESLPIMNNAFLETFNGSGYIVKRERTF
nr:hypothetical protein [Capnocytophaga canimorsus]